MAEEAEKPQIAVENCLGSLRNLLFTPYRKTLLEGLSHVRSPEPSTNVFDNLLFSPRIVRLPIGLTLEASCIRMGGFGKPCAEGLPHDALVRAKPRPVDSLACIKTRECGSTTADVSEFPRSAV